MVQASAKRKSDMTAAETINEMRTYTSSPQYIMYTTFNAGIAVSVNEPSENGAARLLGSALPNPTSGVARIDVSLPTSGHAIIDLYNAVGQKVLSLFNGSVPAGITRVEVNTQNLPAGAYYYKLNWNNITETQILNVVR